MSVKSELAPEYLNKLNQMLTSNGFGPQQATTVQGVRATTIDWDGLDQTLREHYLKLLEGDIERRLRVELEEKYKVALADEIRSQKRRGGNAGAGGPPQPDPDAQTGGNDGGGGDDEPPS